MFRFQHKRLQIQVNPVTPPLPPPLSIANFPSPTPPPISDSFRHASSASSPHADSLADSYLSAEDRALLSRSLGGRHGGLGAAAPFTQPESQWRRESNVTLTTLLSRPSVSAGPPLGWLQPLDLAASQRPLNLSASQRPPPRWNSNRPGSGTSTVSEMSSLSSLSAGRSEPANSSGEENFSLDGTVAPADRDPPLEEEYRPDSLQQMNIAIGTKILHAMIIAEAYTDIGIITR